MGTPKTLGEAISNGLDKIDVFQGRPKNIEVIEAHVRDFLSQKFGVSILECELRGDEPRTERKLWIAITGKAFDR